MTTGRDSTVLWTIAGVLLLAAGLVVVVAMRPSDAAPLPVPPSIDEPAGTRTADAPPTDVEAPPAAPPSAEREAEGAEGDDAQGAAPSAVPAPQGAPPAPEPQGAPVAPEGAPTTPLAVKALRGMQLAAPFAHVLDPGARGPAPEPASARSILEPRLEAMESLLAAKEAEIARMEASVAEAERIGDVDGARRLRTRLGVLRDVRASVSGHVERMRAEGAPAAPN